MSLNLNQKSFLTTLLPGIAIATGVMFKNGGKQLGGDKQGMNKTIGMVLFVGGWIEMAYVL